MFTDRWTVLLLKGDDEEVRQYSMPRSMVRRAGLALGVFGVLFLVAAAFLAYDSGARLRAANLARENRLLEDELGRYRGMLADFDQTIADLAEKDRHARLLTGRVGIDEEVFEVGVGGPGLESPGEDELWRYDPEASEAAYAFRYDLAMLERKADLLDESLDETTAALESDAERLAAIPSISPVGGLVSSHFSRSRRHPIHLVDLPHQGIDVHAIYGTPIVATGAGVVTYAGRMVGYGNLIEIDHGYGYVTRYAHASRLLAHVGKRVRRDEVVAEVGCTGTCTAPHVHYEVRRNGTPVDPLNYVLTRSLP
ncbi:MAG: M23 family metallopeptidase [Gemmatimonadetes bacterium]|nr:M23 family metallopeptidase [Gemmatimonadota bacterium]MCY3610360.1 M23 family metallopeptidase [Gemmatimonadota bacterium]MCY3677289.1 M23 family metallopeptidase [Gemmatimonadota bacterium]MYA42415.1 M23 family metallopeptidase [Gemmatimonadota bacterium]MYE94350.1 M23 family metallopeptidase [Gemmatimonadota bacterium]